MQSSKTIRGGSPGGGSPAGTVSLTVGTAGHIDHGKTALVKLLTGCDCDTMPEEKARGMTIDVGFATCTLPDGRRVGIVDVPGHERFIHNMVAGATGIDVVMLVIAADDGIMQQTLEHFHIVRLLGVKSGMVALTKIDLVDEKRIADMKEQIRALLAGSFLEGCPIAPVSSKTGAGFEEFYEAFVATVSRTAERDASGVFRMHIENSFVLQGLGTIISGIPRSGKVRVGDDLVLLPAGDVKKVRGVQVYGEDVEEAKAGECAALKLSDVSSDQVARGMVLATPGYFTPTRYVNARFHAMPDLDRPLKPRSPVRFHVGTTDATGYLVLPELKPLPRGGEAYVQIQLNEPVVTAPGDFFVARLLTPVRTLGGGYVVGGDTMRMRRSRGDWSGVCKGREEAFKGPAAAIEYALSQGGGAAPLPLKELAHRALLDEDAAREHLAALCKSGVAVALPGERYAKADALKAAAGDILGALNGLHDGRPLSVGFAKKDVLRELRADRLLTDRAMEDLLASKHIASNASGLHIPQRLPQLNPEQAGAARTIADLYLKTGFAAPRRDQVAETTTLPSRIVDPVFDFLVQTGELVVIDEKVVLHKDVVEQSREKLVEHLSAHGSVDAGAFKDLIGASRKYAIPLLEYWDAKGLTKRVGDRRVLKEVKQE